MSIRTALWRLGLGALGVVAALVLIHFPYNVDEPLKPEETARLIRFYTRAYAGNSSQWKGADYVAAAEAYDEHQGVTAGVRRFVAQYGLASAKAVDIGSGRGQLQDVVADYTGIDIAASAARFYHKRFVVGSATALPFPDNQFDTAWSLATLEHVPNPEQALAEMRRVVRDGGLVYLLPTWQVPTWAAAGYGVRPYSDFGLPGKLVKLTVPLRGSTAFRSAYTFPIRLLRLLAPSPTRLRYRRLKPNYHAFWDDSDAVNSIDRYEAAMWFRSRGDECLNCAGWLSGILQRHDPRLVIRVHKRAARP